MTLVGLTVVLGLAVTVALIVAPSLVGAVDASRKVRAQNDCNSLASAIARFRRDTGRFPQWLRAPRDEPVTPGRLVLLVGPGAMPLARTSDTEEWVSPAQGAIGTLADQLIRNTPRYELPDGSAGFGWHGPYLSRVSGDPWNNRYAVNAAFLKATADDTNVNVRAVWVLSAGPNGILETRFSQPARSAALGGDDIGTRIQ